eukprot:scaffold2662_cov202-Prasinococcus_capsulatus_cf.AAC.1
MREHQPRFRSRLLARSARRSQKPTRATSKLDGSIFVARDAPVRLWAAQQAQHNNSSVAGSRKHKVTALPTAKSTSSRPA